MPWARAKLINVTHFKYPILYAQQNQWIYYYTYKYISKILFNWIKIT